MHMLTTVAIPVNIAADPGDPVTINGIAKLLIVATTLQLSTLLTVLKERSVNNTSVFSRRFQL